MIGAEIRDLIEKHGKRPRSKDILINLRKSAFMTPKQLSEKTGASMSTVSQKLTELVRDGIVQSEYKNRRDRRRKAYFLTDEGKKIVDLISKFPSQ